MENKRTRVAGIVQVRQIEERAYTIWECEGRPHGCDVEHWLRAEAELARSTNTNYPAKSQEGSAVRAKEAGKVKRRKT